MSANSPLLFLFLRVAAVLPKTLLPCSTSQQGVTTRARNNFMDTQMMLKITVPETTDGVMVLREEAKAALKRALQAEANLSSAE
mmetsp:Transcript_10507/g.30940  ORF Transcript_10507/g.30940 Transcript_10507/m.30940 type:complete len:84 (+) Transcript_10507:164-415(+)